MQHVRPGLLQNAQFLVVQPDAVRHLHIRADHPDMLQVFEVAVTALAQHLGDFGADLPGVPVDTGPVPVRLLLDLFEQAFGVPQLPAWCKAIADAPVLLSMPAV